MPGGKNNIKPEDGKQFSKDYQPKNRRKPSLKTQLAKVALSDGKMEVDGKNVYIDGEQQKGKKVVLILPREEAMAHKMISHAMGKNPNVSLQALKLYLETFDGKAHTNEPENKTPDKVQITVVKKVKNKGKQSK